MNVVVFAGKVSKNLHLHCLTFVSSCFLLAVCLDNLTLILKKISPILILPVVLKSYDDFGYISHSGERFLDVHAYCKYLSYLAELCNRGIVRFI